MVIAFEARHIVNGGNLSEFIGKNISIFVALREINSQTLYGKSTDDKQIITKLTPDISVTSRPGSWIEIIGVPVSNDSIKAKEVIQFEGGDKEFDIEAYNMAVQYFSHCKDFFRT